MTPLIVGIGGTIRPTSSSEAALRTALDAAELAGARTLCLTAADLDLPLYQPQDGVMTPGHDRLVSAMRNADGLIISSPGYHGAISGMVKNALDYAEDTVNDERVYFDGLPIGCISVAYGSQAAVSTLLNLRTIAHALRAIPTPYGASIVAGPRIFERGVCVDDETRRRLQLVGTQVSDLAVRLGARTSSVRQEL